MAQIIVLGMHRSGTSLATHLIHKMGAYFGDPHVALPPSPDNPAGFWERKDALHLNRSLLRCGNSAWHRVDRYDTRIAKNIPVPLAHGIAMLIRELDAHRPWVLKDPRMCLTLPCWLPSLKNPVAVIASRHPLEIAQSLKMRNAMPVEYALALWEYYAVHLIRAAHALPKAFVRYEELIAAPAETARALHARLESLGVSGLKLPPESDILKTIAPELRRARVNNPVALSPHRESVAAMLRGMHDFDPNIRVSPESEQTMRTIGPQVTGAPAN